MARKKTAAPAKKAAKKDNSTLMFSIFGAAMFLMLLWLVLSNTGALKHIGDKKLKFSTDGLTEYQKVSCYDAAKVYYGYSVYYNSEDGGTARFDYDKNNKLSLASYYNKEGDSVRILSASSGDFTGVTDYTYEDDRHGSEVKSVSTYGRISDSYITYDKPGDPVTFEYEYDAQGNMTKRSRTGPSGTSVTTYKNAYDSAGALASVEVYDKDGAMTQRTVYRADGSKDSVESYSEGQLAELEQFDEHGNMTQHLFYKDGKQDVGNGSLYTYDYNPDGSIAVKYDATDDSSSYNYYYVYEYPKA